MNDAAADDLASKIEALREQTRAANLALAELKDVLRDIRAERAAVQDMLDSIPARAAAAVDAQIVETLEAGMTEWAAAAAKSTHDAYDRIQRNMDKLTRPIMTMIAERTGAPLPEAFDPKARR